jgi:hypothetical protein
MVSTSPKGGAGIFVVDDVRESVRLCRSYATDCPAARDLRHPTSCSPGPSLGCERPHTHPIRVPSGSASLRLCGNDRHLAELVDRDDISVRGAPRPNPIQEGFPPTALNDDRVGSRVRLDLEALLELRLEECIESFLPSPRRIDRSSHGFYTLRGMDVLALRVDLCLPQLHASRANACWRGSGSGRRFWLQGQ